MHLSEIGSDNGVLETLSDFSRQSLRRGPDKDPPESAPACKVNGEPCSLPSMASKALVGDSCNVFAALQLEAPLHATKTPEERQKLMNSFLSQATCIQLMTGCGPHRCEKGSPHQNKVNTPPPLRLASLQSKASLHVTFFLDICAILTTLAQQMTSTFTPPTGLVFEF